MLRHSRSSHGKVRVTGHNQMFEPLYAFDIEFDNGVIERFVDEVRRLARGARSFDCHIPPPPGRRACCRQTTRQKCATEGTSTARRHVRDVPSHMLRARARALAIA